MKVLDVAVAPLASARFHISPVNQLMGLLRLAASGRRHPTRRAPVRETVRALATEDGALLRELVPPRGRGILPIVGVGPHRDVAGLADELEAIAAQPQSQLAREVALLTRPAPRVIRSLEAGTLGRDAARAVHRIWQLTLAESWPVLERELRMETVRRASAVGAVGWASTIGALHPSVSWLAGERTSIVLDKPVRVHEAMADDGTLTLIPSAYLIDEPLVTAGTRDHGIFYPLPGDPERRAGGDATARLLGATRARVLDGLAGPITTSGLARRLDLPLSTVSTHLSVLHEAGLVDRQRAGRSVVWERVG